MKIFPKDSKLEAQFRAGRAPTILGPLDSTNGEAEWRVDMLTGPIPNMGGRPFYHRKVFEIANQLPVEVGGCNVFTIKGIVKILLWLFLYLFNFDGRWGSFRLEMKDEYLLINYDVSENGWLTRRIRDHIRTTDDPDVMIGKFHWVWRGREIFLGFFTLTRIKGK